MRMLLTLVITIIFGCTSHSKENATNISNEIAKTEAFQNVSKEVDSLKASGMIADIQIAIINAQTLNQEDSLTKLKIAFIEISTLNGVDVIECYKVKYDSVSNKIHSIENTR